MRSFIVFSLLASFPILAGSMAAAEIGVIQGNEDQSAFWLRHVVRLKNPAKGESIRLSVRGVCRASVYFNGQRLVRNSEVKDGQTVQFDVTELVRSGPNGIAVVAYRSSDDQPAVVSAWLSNGLPEILAATGTKWKRRNAAPPVGWQQTDFNPHGWVDAEAESTISVEQATADETAQHDWRRAPVAGGHNVPVSLTDGDHVVLLGGTFVERAQIYGHLEAMLTATAGSGRLTFRNLGWSGDTVDARSRGIFDTPQKGYERLVEHIRAEEPTTIMVCYGQNEAMTDAGQAAVAKFGEQLQQLHRGLKSTGARFVFVSPHPLLYAEPPIPSPNRFNPAIEEYAVEMQRVARLLDVAFTDLFSDLPATLGRIQTALQPDSDFKTDLISESSAWTDNGMHWNEVGYRRIAVMLAERCLRQEFTSPAIRVDPVDQSVEVQGGAVRNVQWVSGNQLELEFRVDQLTPLPCVVELSTKSSETRLRRATVNSAHGPFRLITSSNDESLLRFVGELDDQYERMRLEIVRKNELYFHRWRPQNITYLYGFRKHEQGNNAAEIAMFDPLVDEHERRIQTLREPEWQTIRINY